MENYTLKDIAGYKEEKEQLKQIIDVFINYKNYKTMGIYIPKGLILSGEPGVGKTLFAKVLATEINAPFYYIDGSMLDNNRGAKQILQVFKKARQNKPAVIFIDELNSFIGDEDYNTDFTKKNLSVLLKLIDGLSSNDGVFVVGAASDKEELDSALIRSGRMDKHICLNAPSYSSRMDILNYYLNKIELDKSNINKKVIVEKIHQFNGADIKTLVNESCIDAVANNVPLTTELMLKNAKQIEQQDIVRNINKDVSLIAYHTIGHMVVAKKLMNYKREISIEFMHDNIEEDSVRELFNTLEDSEDDDIDIKSFETKQSILNKIAIVLGSVAIQDVILGTRYTDLAQDINVATKLVFYAFANGLYGFKYATEYLDCRKVSEHLFAEIETKKEEILNAQFNVAVDIISANKQNIEKLYKKLVKTKYLSDTDFDIIK